MLLTLKEITVHMIFLNKMIAYVSPVFDPRHKTHNPVIWIH